MANLDIIKKVDRIIINSSSATIIEQILNSETDLVSDLMFDSISIISLVIELEKEFNFEFDDDFLRLEYLHHYDWLIEYIEGKVNKGGSENIIG